MAFTIPDKGEGANDVQSILFQEYLDVIIAGLSGTDCVVSGCAVTAQATPNMTVAVAAGTVMSNGTAFEVAGANGTITAADAASPRLDLVVITSAGAIAVRAGTPALNPKPAARVANDVVLAVVYVPAADTTIEAAQITDLRVLNNRVSAFAKTILDDANQGAALTTLGAPLNSIVAKTAAYTVVATDRGILIDCTGTWTLTLTAAATLGAGFSFSVRNSGTGIITIDPNGTEPIDDVATIPIEAAQTCSIITDGAAWKTTGRSTGKVLQSVYFKTGAVATGSTVIPLDDTIPQNTEGNEYMSLAITPKSATSKLFVEVVCALGVDTVAWVISAIFRDADANSVGTTMRHQPVAGAAHVQSFNTEVASNSIALTTFKVRAGPGGAAIITFNGVSDARYMGGSMASSIRITEIAA